MGWFGIRCLFRFCDGTYEERVTIWHADDFDAAIQLAENEAAEYATTAGDRADATEYLGLAQAFEMSQEPGHGAEVFSLLRDSSLDGDAYVEAFFDTGAERQSAAE